MCVCVLLSHLFWTSDVWTHQPRSHRRKVTQDFSTFLQRSLPQFLSGEMIKTSLSLVDREVDFFVYPQTNRSPIIDGHFFFFFFREEKFQFGMK